MEIPSAFYEAKWIFGLLALRMALKVNSDHKFKIYGLCFLCQHGFICSWALHRLSATFVEMRKTDNYYTCVAAGKKWGQSSRVILLTTHPPPLPLSLLLYLSPHIELDRSVRAVPPLPPPATPARPPLSF